MTPRRRTRPDARRRRLFWLETLEDRAVPSATPVAAADFADTDGRNPVSVAVLANDGAIGGRTHIVRRSLTLADIPDHGRVTVNRITGRFTYTADAGFEGTDSFAYTFRDRKGATSNPATVTIQVHLPHAIDDFADTDGTNAVSVPVLDNDSDPDGHEALKPSSVQVLTAPDHGTATVNHITGRITYHAAIGFEGTDTFTYRVRDIHGATSNPATVTIQVHRPLANDDFATTNEGTPVVVDVLENDSDPDGAQHLLANSVKVTQAPQHGQVTLNTSTGALTYTPAAGFFGTDSFKYTVADDHKATSAPATVTVAVLATSPRNQAVANADVADTDGTNPVTIDVLHNDGGPNALDPGSVMILSRPSHGTATVDSATGEITYTAFPGFAGTDTFSYLVEDSTDSLSNGATVTVIVNEPHANDDFADTDGTTPVVVNVLANDSDPDGAENLDPGTVTVISGPSHGSVSVNATTGEVTYTADAGFAATDTFAYTVTDEAGATSNPATVTILIHVPIAADDFALADGTNPVAIDVLGNDSDPDGVEHLLPASVTVTSPPAHGSVSVNTATGAITYTADPQFAGSDTFQYIVSDDHGGVSSPATVTVNTVLPVAYDVTTNVMSGRAVNINPLVNAYDPQGRADLNPASVQLLSPPAHGTATINPQTGMITYRPASGFTGTEVLWYSIATRQGTRSDWGQITITVR